MTISRRFRLVMVSKKMLQTPAKDRRVTVAPDRKSRVKSAARRSRIYRQPTQAQQKTTQESSPNSSSRSLRLRKVALKSSNCVNSQKTSDRLAVSHNKARRKTLQRKGSIV